MAHKTVAVISAIKAVTAKIFLSQKFNRSIFSGVFYRRGSTSRVFYRDLVLRTCFPDEYQRAYVTNLCVDMFVDKG